MYNNPQLFHRKNHCFFNEKTMIFSMKKLIFPGFWKILQKNLRFFFDLKKKFFFGVEKKSWVQLRCKKMRSLDCWYFQSDPSNPTARKVVLPEEDPIFFQYFRKCLDIQQKVGTTSVDALLSNHLADFGKSEKMT